MDNKQSQQNQHLSNEKLRFIPHQFHFIMLFFATVLALSINALFPNLRPALDNAFQSFAQHKK